MICLKWVRIAPESQQFGFSLRHCLISDVRDGGGTPCQNVRRAAQRMLAAVDTQIAELRARRRQMARTLKLWAEEGTLSHPEYKPIM